MSASLTERRLIIGSPVRAENPGTPNAAMARRRAPVEPRARILYVDDEPQLRRLVEMVLLQSGYDVDTAADGAEAWAALHDENYNLLITDHEMPRMKGLELATQARLAGMKIPIVLTSGSEDALRDPAGAWLGLAARLRQPFSPELLLETVEEVLRTANGLPARGGTMISFLARAALVQPYMHGGINEWSLNPRTDQGRNDSSPQRLDRCHGVGIPARLWHSCGAAATRDRSRPAIGQSLVVLVRRCGQDDSSAQTAVAWAGQTE